MSSTPDPHGTQSSASSAATGADHGTTMAGDPSPAYAPPPSGPRVSRDQVRDLGRLRRSTTDRKVAGVAAGLARHLDIDPVILRVAFVVLTLFGGAGLVVYGACWLLLPEDGQETAPLGLDDRSRGVALIVAGLIGLAVLLGQGDWFWVPGPLIGLGLVVWLLMARRQDSSTSTTHPAPPPGVPGAGPGAVTPEQRWSAVAPAYAPAAGQPGPAPAYAPATGPVGYHPAPASPAPSTASHFDPGHAGPTGPTGPIATQVVQRPSSRSGQPRNPRKRGPILFWFTMALAALAVGVLGIVDLAGVAVPGSAYPATVLAVTGAMLLVGAFFGRAGGLILVGLLAAAATSVGLAVEKVEPNAIEITPTTAAAVPAEDSFELGSYRLDLSRVSDPEELDGRTISISGEVGELLVIVPDGVDVTATGQVDGPGAITLFGDDRGGIDTQATSSYDGGPQAPHVTLDLQLEVGHIEVRTPRAGDPFTSRDITRGDSR